jgi:phosphatidylethanolamine/phosphatidyl-N-methylethanolamine N-methyltransferase
MEVGIATTWLIHPLFAIYPRLPMSARSEAWSQYKPKRRLPQFAREFLQSPSITGAVCASSPFLARRLASAVDLSQARSVLEVGPGSGAITERLVRQMPARARLTTIEINPRFAEMIRLKFPSAAVICGGVEELAGYMRRNKMEPFDCVVSSLPWTSFEAELQRDILEQVYQALRPGGEIATYAYWGFHWLPSASAFRQQLRGRFQNVKASPVVWANLPPAFVYHARK